ncbi:MAG: Nif3-like dinuclear metal center hexameric protein [Clostridia bacterium]|nr:Nif3-like dinuclear metal center hexameric protein [Clostridia bacterium]
MSNVKEIYSELDALIPHELSAAWDNDGLMVCPDGKREVRRVLLALDATSAVVDEAKDFDLIITHHPILFRKIGAVTEEQFVSKKVIDLISRGVSVMSFHTRFDSMDGGMNDIFAAKLGLSNVGKFGDAESPTLGRIGDIAPTDASALTEKVKKTLGAPFVLCADTGKTIKKLAVCGGDGGDFILPAKAAGADALLTGRAGYNRAVDAIDSGITVIEAGHYYTEAIFAEYFEAFFKTHYPEITVTRSSRGCAIKAI